jgi:lipopolysaccharide/colanic/teichoic acid biosynthesis glycosyltransferase
MDLTCVTLSLPFVLPVALGVLLLIKLVSKGPVLFAQERVGLGRSRFRCLKFRTMKSGANSLAHREHTAELMNSSKPWAKMDGNDPRLIPLGGFLRATGLDELPQLLNVLRGEMSLVGPRPCTAYELEHYLPWQLARFDVLPGLTGLWQVSGKNRTTFTEMICMDIDYAKTASIRLDTKIILKTIPALVDQVSDKLILKQLHFAWDKDQGTDKRETERGRPGGKHRLHPPGTDADPQVRDPARAHAKSQEMIATIPGGASTLILKDARRPEHDRRS